MVLVMRTDLILQSMQLPAQKIFIDLQADHLVEKLLLIKTFLIDRGFV